MDLLKSRLFEKGVTREDLIPKPGEEAWGIYDVVEKVWLGDPTEKRPVLYNDKVAAQISARFIAERLEYDPVRVQAKLYDGTGTKLRDTVPTKMDTLEALKKIESKADPPTSDAAKEHGLRRIRRLHVAEPQRPAVNHRTLGTKGIYVKPEGNPPWFNIGKEIDYYDHNGEKRLGIIRGISGAFIRIQDANDRGMRRFRLMTLLEAQDE